MQVLDVRGKSLLQAQAKARELLALIEEQQLVKIGLTEQDVSEQIFELARQRFSVTKHWHKRIVRAGPNSVLPYKANPDNRTIEANDLVYVDLGPVFDDFEGDIGKTYLLGSDPAKRRLIADLERLFNECKGHYFKEPGQTGAMFYHYIVDQCQKAGWTYGNNSAGHLVSEFAHQQVYGDWRITKSELTTTNR